MDRVFLPAATVFWLAGVSLLIGCGKNGVAPPPPPARIGIQAGNNQQAPIGTTLAIAPAAAVSDQSGNPVSNVSVTFAVASGGGSVTGGNTTTNTSGVATVGSWTLGPLPGTNTVTATASGSGIAGNPATFTATGCTNCWTTKASMPTARWLLATEQVGNILYALGGANPNIIGVLATVEAYDPSTNTWTTRASMPTARQGLGVTAINGILYAVGGLDAAGNLLATVEAYDPSNNIWTTKASMPTARTGLGVTAINGILYAVGGDVGGAITRTVEAYDPGGNTWTTEAPMPTARSGLGATAINGILYAFGGSSASAGDEATVEAYDPSSNTWTTKVSMPTQRALFGATSINGILYAAGGVSKVLNQFIVVATVEAYDPSTNTWTTKASMPTARYAFAGTAINGMLYAVGGFDDAAVSIVGTLTAYQP